MIPSARLSVASEYYSSEKLFVEFQSKDGDRVSLSMEQVHYQKSMASVEGKNLSEEDWKEMVKGIKDELLEMKREMVRAFVESTGGKVQPEKTGKESEVDVTAGIDGLPEYWNAENTSQRIVDFALSFRDLFEGTDEEYAELMKGAIDKGFDLAMGEMGQLPDKVNQLVSTTHSLVHEKLDAWLASRGEEQPQAPETNVQPQVAA